MTRRPWTDADTELLRELYAVVQVGFVDKGEWRFLDAMPIPDSVEVTHWAELPPHPEDL